MPPANWEFRWSSCSLPRKGTPAEIQRVFAAMEKQRPDALLVSGEADLYAHRQLIAEFARAGEIIE